MEEKDREGVGSRGERKRLRVGCVWALQPKAHLLAVEKGFLQSEIPFVRARERLPLRVVEREGGGDAERAQMIKEQTMWR